MIRSFTRSCAAAIAFASIAAFCAPAIADTPPATAGTNYHFETAITPVYGNPYPIAGKLDIQITPAGILRGYYHNAYQKAFIQVVGGRDGNYIWFDIGPLTSDIGIPGIESPNGRIHIVGTMGSDGSIHAQIFPNYAPANEGLGPNPNLGANPNALSDKTLDQYLFAAKPVEPDANTTNPNP